MQCVVAVAVVAVILATTLAPVLAEGRPWQDSHRPTSIGAMAHLAPAAADPLVDPPAHTATVFAVAALLAILVAGGADRRWYRRRGSSRRSDAAFVDDQQRGPPLL